MILSMKDICKDYPMGKSMLRVLKNVNLQVEEGEAFRPEKKATTLVDSITLEATVDGCWYPCVELGETVKKGQKIGELRDLFGTVLEELAAPYDGINIYMVVSLAVSVGDPLISIGKL